MEKVKYCPKCQKVHPVDATNCECGYEFYINKEEKIDHTVATSNARVIVDNTPVFIWSWGAFFTLSIMGWIWFKKFKEDYPVRSAAAKKGAITFYITLGVVVLIFLFLLYLKSTNKIA